MYLIIFAVSFWIMLMYDGVFMEGLFAAVVFLPIICIIIKYIIIHNIDINWTSDSIKAGQGTTINVMSVLCNHFFLPVSRATITFELEDVLGNKEEYKIVTNLLPFMNRYCTLELCPNYSGSFLVRLKSVKINDILGLTSAAKKIGSMLTLLVYPKIRDESIPVTVENDAVYKEDSDEFSDLISGNDKSQIFDINQYQVGDSIRDIHWKLSSKTDNLMVKRYSYPIEKQINVFIDYAKPDNKRITTAGIGRFFDRLFDFLNELEKNKESVCLYAFVGNEGECRPINKEDLLYLNINNGSHTDTVCRSFMKNIGMGGNILISSRITKEKLYDYDNLSSYYINWDELYSDKENAPKEIFIEDTGIIGIYPDNCDEEKKPLAELGDEVYINKDDEEIEVYTYIFRMLLVLLGSIIPALIFYDVLVVYESTPIRIVIFPMLAVLLMFIATFIRSRVIKAAYLIVALSGGVLLLGINNIIDGAVKTVKAFGNSMMYYDTGYGLSLAYKEQIAYFVAFVAFVYAVLLFMFTWNSIAVIIHMILTIPPVALCLAYGCVPDNIYTVMYAAYISGIFVYSVTYKNIVKAEKRVLKKAFYESTINIGAILSYTVMAITIAVMLINAVKGYHRPEVLSNMKAEINSYIDGYGLEKKKINKNTATGGLNSGKLGAVSRVTYSGEIILNINVSGKLNFPLYLRGYIGSTYTGDSWEILSEEKDFEMEYRLEGTGLSMHTIYNLPYYIMDEENKGIEEMRLGKVNSGNVIIENMIETDSTYYIPYGAFISPDVVVIRDGEIINNVYGSKSYDVYQLEGIDNLSEYFNQNFEDGDTDYLTMERLYRSIAYDYYSHFDGNDKTEERLRSEMLWECEYNGVTYNLNDGPENIGYEPYIQAVKNYLSDNYTYNLSPGKLGASEDFIEKFMDDRKGYCTHFATIATEMFRIYGIPARYVEGYYVKPQPVDMLEYYKNQSITLNVQDDCAHAWTEIYIDGLGFIPVEATPGYTGMRYVYEEETSSEPVSNNNPRPTVSPNETTTTAPQQQTTPEKDITTTTDDKSEESEGVNLFGFMKNKYIVSILIVVIIVAVILGRKSRYDRKNDEIVRRKRTKEALMWESQLEKMAGTIRPVLKLPNDDTRQELSDRIIKYIDESKGDNKKLNREEVENMFLVFDKAIYSEEGADSEELSRAASTASDILDVLYKNQSFMRRIYIKYIKCLYLK